MIGEGKGISMMTTERTEQVELQRGQMKRSRLRPLYSPDDVSE